jgi:hypothetical protein
MVLVPVIDFPQHLQASIIVISIVLMEGLLFFLLRQHVNTAFEGEGHFSARP